MRRVTLFAVVAALSCFACNGEVATETFGSAPETDLVDAITTNVSEDPDRPFDDEETDCLVQGIVDEFGTDGLAELGVTPENPDLQGGSVFATPDSARRAVDVGMECIDVPEAIASYLPADVNLLDDSVQCLAEQFQTETFRNFFAELVAEGAEPADILGYGGAQLSIATLLLTCLSPEEILRVNELLP